MADSPPDAGAPSATPVSEHSSPHRSPHRSPHTSPPRSPRQRIQKHGGSMGDDLDDEILKGAAWAPPWTEHELHSREVYARSQTPSPPCEKYKRDVTYDEINQNVVEKREQDAKKSHKEALEKHKHAGLVMQRAREFERKCRMECEKNSKQLSEYKARMQKREADLKGPFRNRAEQIVALGLNKNSSSRPASPKHHQS